MPLSNVWTHFNRRQISQAVDIRFEGSAPSSRFCIAVEFRVTSLFLLRAHVNVCLDFVSETFLCNMIVLFSVCRLDFTWAEAQSQVTMWATCLKTRVTSGSLGLPSLTLEREKLIEGTVNLTFYLFVRIHEINQVIEFLKDRMYLNFSS